MLYNLAMTNDASGATRPDIHQLFVDLRAGAREQEPGSWWLRQTELTTLGYEAIVGEVADEVTRACPGREPLLLDWGAGPAFTTFLLEHLGVPCVYYDFQTDYPSYRWTLDQLASDKHFIGEDTTALPFEDDSFDAALSCGVLEHVPHPHESLAEIIRVLKPGGLFFVYHFPNRYSYTEALAGVIGQSNHSTRWSKTELLRALEDVGFELVWFDRRYMIPRNLVDFPAARRFVSSHARGLFRFDRALSRVPGVSIVSNALNCMVRKPSG